MVSTDAPVSTTTPGGGLTDQAEGRVGGTFGDTAAVRNRYAEQLQGIAQDIARGDVQNAQRKVEQLIAVISSATDQNFRAQLGLEAVQGNMGNMLKIFGTILKALGAEDVGQGMIDLANDPNLRLDRVMPDTRELEALRTVLPPELQGQVDRVLGNGFNGAYGQAQRTPTDVLGQADRGIAGATGVGGGPPAPAGGPAAAPAPAGAREPITVARAMEAGRGLGSPADIRSIQTSFTTADANRNGTLEGAEVQTFRTALTPAARTALEPMFAPAGP